MSKVLTKSDEIQSFLEELLSKEDTREKSLKLRLDALSNKSLPVSNNAQEIVFGSEAILICGSNKRTKIIRPNISFDDFICAVRFGFGPEKPQEGTYRVGYRDDSGRIILLENKDDLQLLFRWYFAKERQDIHIVLVPNEECEGLKKILSHKDYTSKVSGAVFRCEVFGNQSPLIFFNLPTNLNQQHGFEFISNIFGPIINIMFFDDAGDRISIDSNDSWEYCIETAVAMHATGNYPLLILQTSA